MKNFYHLWNEASRWKSSSAKDWAFNLIDALKIYDKPGYYMTGKHENEWIGFISKHNNTFDVDSKKVYLHNIPLFIQYLIRKSSYPDDSVKSYQNKKFHIFQLIDPSKVKIDDSGVSGPPSAFQYITTLDGNRKNIIMPKAQDDVDWRPTEMTPDDFYA